MKPSGFSYTRPGSRHEAPIVTVVFYSDRIDAEGGFVTAEDEAKHKAWLKKQDAAGVPRERTVLFEPGDFDGIPRDGSV